MIVIRRTFILLMVFGVFVMSDTNMFTNKIDKTQAVMGFVVVIVMGNKFGNKRKGMCRLPW